MLYISDQLGLTASIYTVPGHFSLNMLNRFVAYRTLIWRRENMFISSPEVRYRSHNIGNHFSGSLHHHPVTHSNILFGYEVEVVQCGLLYRHTSDLHRSKNGIRRQYSCSANIYTDFFQFCCHNLGWEFIGNSPSGRLADHSQCISQHQIINLDHNPINFIIQSFSELIPFIQLIDHRLN